MVRCLIPLLATLPLAAAEVAWAWAGGVGQDRATVVAKADGPVALRIATDWSAAGPAPAALAPDSDGIVRLSVEGLRPGTAYAWGVAGAAAPLGSFSTLPPAGTPASFTLAFGSCSKEPESPVFASIAAQRPLFFLCPGDLHYGDIDTDDAARIRALVTARPAAAAWRQLTAIAPIVYMWDDHDFGGNNSGWGSKAAPAVHAVYRQVVPHHPLAGPGPQVPISQAWSVGRVRFVMPDLRSERDRTPGSLLGDDQRGWIAAEIAAAPASHRLLVLVSSVPWNGAASGGKDRWQSYAAERTWLARLIKQAGIRACVLAGDAHMAAIDDGANSDFAGGWPMPVFQAAALDMRGSYKGGPYSHGANPGTAQFGVMRVEDAGAALTVTWEARDGSDGVGTRIVSASRDLPGGEARPIAHSFQVP
jgi:hypothetical protein